MTLDNKKNMWKYTKTKQKNKTTSKRAVLRTDHLCVLIFMTV